MPGPPRRRHRTRALREAQEAFKADLDILAGIGADHRFADWLAALPDPGTDGQEHP